MRTISDAARHQLQHIRIGDRTLRARGPGSTWPLIIGRAASLPHFTGKVYNGSRLHSMLDTGLPTPGRFLVQVCAPSAPRFSTVALGRARPAEDRVSLSIGLGTEALSERAKAKP